MIHVNDNFGRWRSDFDEVIAWCSRECAAGGRHPLDHAIAARPAFV